MDDEIIEVVKQDLQQGISKISPDKLDQLPISGFLKVCKETQNILNSVVTFSDEDTGLDSSFSSFLRRAPQNLHEGLPLGMDGNGKEVLELQKN